MFKPAMLSIRHTHWDYKITAWKVFNKRKRRTFVIKLRNIVRKRDK